MTQPLVLIAVAVALIGVLYLVRRASRRAADGRAAESGFDGVVDSSSSAASAHISHSHVDCPAHSVDCGGHGGH